MLFKQKHTTKDSVNQLSCPIPLPVQIKPLKIHNKLIFPLNEAQGVATMEQNIAKFIGNNNNNAGTFMV